ncbi:DNA polymerase III subunit alpha [Anaplasma marginale str. Dawn]|uniref:DNA polymerase III subunit alpha n=1 Tax=Anaplasma marginale TaxID=770 RepID=UPI000313BEB6|nr:DNA polymerase III subunit alpha [Anaplasma marginale]AGZ78658.1 DNA polymerase III subunit alpha [Anaplasma marginale str. Gypsy Plains]AGZ79506.1 DNA polymerase III subunit alpha [Anaplasma marginale str. Dawn]RCL19670.1 DNA polymerase III subunit alpha [Anaplasma marginale]TZF79347.1 DNA polymerase III subunit alpha [Anaplasma marginale]
MIDGLFVHLRTHSDYSLLEGMIKIESLVAMCVDQNMPAVALTDSGNLFGSLEFSDCAASFGVQPIVGCNIMVHDAGEDLGNILMLTKSHEGFVNLISLVSNGFKENQSGKANRVDVNSLLRQGSGLLLLTGGHDDILARALLGKSAGMGAINAILETFGNDVYVELQRHGLESQKEVEGLLIGFAYERNIPLVATNDVFFVRRGDFQAHDVLSCISDGTYIVQEGRRRLTEEHYFKTSKEMFELFSDIPEAVRNTPMIARRCAFIAEIRKPSLPHFPCSGGRTEAEELTECAKTGLEARLRAKNIDGDKKEQYHNRLQYELGIVISMDYSGYFLIVADFICWSKKNDIMVGPGRGSGAGSLIAWSLGITDLDPIEFGLIFERFLNPERVSMPDFDIDFCQEKRDKVIEYVREKYGYVAHIITFGKLQARAVLRDVGRVMQIPYAQIDKICKMIPHDPVSPVTLSEAIEMDQNLKREKESDNTVAKLFEISLKLEGLYRHASVHAAGIVICDKPLEDFVPLYYDQSCSLPITQYNMKYVEKAGLVKFDFLGLRTLTVLDQVRSLIQDRGVSIELSELPLDDGKTYEMLSTGNSVGVFQLESAGMREAISKLRPDGIQDIIALISLYRPGPMNNIAIYIARKHGLEKPDYIHPMLEGVLKETFGVIIYQEQVMEIARILAGYSLGGADLLRRAMGKKIKEEMDKQRQDFVNGAIKNGIDRGKASYIFDLVAKFAGYGFNKSHAAAYALISFQTAYLKANYTKEFFTASMNLDIGDKDKLELLCQQARACGVQVLPPDVNSSGVLFTISGDAIKYGLGALKNVGQTAAREVVPEAGKKYSDIWDFARNMRAKWACKRVMESLIKSGALDSIHPNRRQLFESLGTILDVIDDTRNSAESKQFNLFGITEGHKLLEVEDWSEEEKIEHEFSTLGFYLRYHPLAKYEGILRGLGVKFVSECQDSSESGVKKSAGVISSVRIRSANKERFAVVRISDPYGVNDVAFYNSRVIEAGRDLFHSGVSVMIDMDYNSVKSRLIGKNIYSFGDGLTAMTQKMKNIVIHFSQGHYEPNTLGKILRRDRGKTEVFVEMPSKGNLVLIKLPGVFQITAEAYMKILGLSWVQNISVNHQRFYQ